MAESVLESISDQILNNDLAVVDDVLGVGVLDALRIEALEEYAMGEFQQAHIGKGIAKQRMVEIRSDKVLWLDRGEATEAQLAYWQLMDGLRAELGNFFRIHLERTELHFAVYPPGAFYAPHLDQFRDHSNRVFSVITYLNPDWQPGHGGELRVHHDDGSFHDIAPLHGRLVCFRSDKVLHEVMEAVKVRVSLTGWMRRDALLL